MQTIIQYMQKNSTFTLIFLLSLLVCALIIALIVFFYKKSERIKPNNFEQNSNNLKNSTEIQNNSIDNEEIPSLEDTENDLNKQNCPCVEAEQIEEVKEEKEPEIAVEEVKNQTLNEENSNGLGSAKQNETNSNLNGNLDKNEPLPTQPVKYAGKWLIIEEEGRFFAELTASNGEMMLRTESYSSLSGIKSGIDTLKKNIEMENYAINLDKNGNFVFKIFSTAKRLLCVGEGYTTREQCEKAFLSVKRFSKTANIVLKKDE